MKPRQADRYWAIPGTKAEFISNIDKEQITVQSQRIWDISEEDCGVELTTTPTFKPGQMGKLRLVKRAQGSDIPSAKIERVWEGGMALSFPHTAETRSFFRGKKNIGHSHSEEFDRKKDLALIEIQELGTEVRQLKDCQIRLFFTCFAISIGLGSLLAVLYQMGAPLALNSLVATGPAVAAVVFGLMSLHKNIQMNRASSFILHLKQQLDQACFLPGYRGWEDAVANLTHCKRMECSMEPRCENTTGQLKAIATTARFRAQPSLFSTIMSMSYMTIYLISLYVVISFLLTDQGAGSIFKLAVVTTVTTTLLAIAAGIFTYLAWFGKYSFLFFYLAWKRVLNHCVPFQPNNLAVN